MRYGWTNEMEIVKRAEKSSFHFLKFHAKRYPKLKNGMDGRSDVPSNRDARTHDTCGDL